MMCTDCQEVLENGGNSQSLRNLSSVSAKLVDYDGPLTVNYVGFLFDFVWLFGRLLD
jgi:hypothetical protein